MTKKIRIITPHTTPRPTKLDELAGLDNFIDVTFSQVGLDTGPASIESAFDDALSAVGVVSRAIEAQNEGIDAVIIDCMGDPGLDAAREAVSIPVLGPGETGMHMAAMLGHKFSVVTILDRVCPILENHAKIYGVQDKLASVRPIDIAVNDIAHNETLLIEKLTEQSLLALTQDKASVILLGCTGFLGISEKLSAALQDAGYPAPVLNPLRTAVMTAFGLISLGLTQSSIAWPPPSPKAIKGFTIPKLVS
ncbi:aspartate/glutamate racemase family protein [Govanella unica]|uniref:Aspartate/glutamate racemase family protein n=1 Tax=Govanella unica TaxID=2975056 RepID=A0A9X3TYU1_9PROT|nr:aspartate/glutamate racemase family protein [Govania unica]MDA5194123.1 aspartate/glutamate racemase family protein [Govania unica]